jgi:hypothetical protein
LGAGALQRAHRSLRSAIQRALVAHCVGYGWALGFALGIAIPAVIGSLERLSLRSIALGACLEGCCLAHGARVCEHWGAVVDEQFATRLPQEGS